MNVADQKILEGESREIPQRITKTQMVSLMKTLTSEAITVANAASTQPMPEFGRWQDVRRYFGIKRGVLYQLIKEGRVRSVLLRRPGNAHGCRLIHLASVSEYLNGLMTEQKSQH